MEKPLLKKLILPALLVLQACATQPTPEPAPEPVARPAPAAVPPPPTEAKAEPARPKAEPARPAPKPRISKPEPITTEPVAIEPPPRPSEGIDRAKEPTDLWLRIRAGFAIQDLTGALVKQKTKQYAARPEYLQRILERSKLYLY